MGGICVGDGKVSQCIRQGILPLFPVDYHGVDLLQIVPGDRLRILNAMQTKIGAKHGQIIRSPGEKRVILPAERTQLLKGIGEG